MIDDLFDKFQGASLFFKINLNMTTITLETKIVTFLRNPSKISMVTTKL